MRWSLLFVHKKVKSCGGKSGQKCTGRIVIPEQVSQDFQPSFPVLSHTCAVMKLVRPQTSVVFLIFSLRTVDTLFNRSLISGLVWSEIFLLFLLCILWTNEKNESGAHTVCAVCQQGVSKEQCSAHKISLCLSYCFGGRTLSACQVSFWQMQNLAVKSAIIYLSGVSIVYIEE